MTKAKKGLIITLFAAMMVFAFGATSAFAATDKATASYNSDYTVVTISGCTDEDAVYNGPYDTVRTFQDSDQARKGSVRVEIDQTKVAGLPVGVLNAAATNYLDLDSATFGFGTEASYTAVVDTYANYNAWYDASVSGQGLILTAPAGTYTGATAPKVFLPFDEGQMVIGNWIGTYSTDPETVESSTKDQDVTLKLTQSWASQSMFKANIKGKVNDKKVTIKGTPATPATATMGLDKATEPMYVYYDGAEHTVVMSDLPGYTVEYTVFNSDTGAWDKVDSVKITDVGSVNFKVVIKNSEGTDVTKPAWKDQAQIATVRVNPQIGSRLGLGFEATSSTAAYYPVEGTTYDAYSWMKAYSKDTTAKRTTAAIEANSAEFVAALKDTTIIKEKVNKDDNNIRTLSVAINPDLEDKDFAALNKKYETLLKNFGIASVESLVGYVSDSAVDDADYYATAIVELNQTTPNVKRDHIYFTEAPNMTYKAKKIKKASKSFTVAAVADSGNAVSYKISSPSKKITINSETGKITVKKGLKKGTYKVKVYAQTEAGNGYAAAYTYEPAQLTIKIKK